MNYCSNCGTALQPGAGFCSNCGTAVGQAVASQPEQRTLRQDMARGAMAAQTVTLVAQASAIIGGIAGFVLWAMLLYEPLSESNPLLWFGGAIVAGLVGLFVGGRLALMLMAR